MRWMDLAMGFVWLGLGIVVLSKREWLVQNAVESGDSFCDSLKIPQASESSRKIGGKIIATLVGIGLIFFGSVQVYASFTRLKIFQ
jgi:hypothetical protein